MGRQWGPVDNIPPSFGPIAHLVGRPKKNISLTAFNDHMKSRYPDYIPEKTLTYSKFSQEDYNEMQQDRTNGMTPTEIANKFETSISFIYEKTTNPK